ncbi:hypothetical protein [Meiothermus rufus]|uniref:hypothetical protein n=1 Tax=Meiothermus rufus TaxID=604332 RepID=UPI00041CE9CB|nr:hypothetical protein [Meiothermus rufus]
MGRPRYNKRIVLRAIEGSGGIVSAVAKRLGASWSTARALIQRWPETQAAFEAEREKTLDEAESVIHRAIQEGDAQAAKWLLSRLGRHRGYGDHVEVSGRQALEIVLRWPDEEAVTVNDLQ